MTLYLHFPDNSALIAELNFDSQKQSPVGSCSSSAQIFRAVTVVEYVVQFCYGAYAAIVVFGARWIAMARHRLWVVQRVKRYRNGSALQTL